MIRLFVVIWFQLFSGNWFMDELKGLLTEMLQELRRIRYAIVGADQDLQDVDSRLAAQSESATEESGSPDSVVQEFLRGFH